MLSTPQFIRGADINETIYKAIQYVMHEGKEIETRNGSARYVNDLTLQIDNPLERHLSLKGRSYNLYQLIAETLWVLSGSGEISPYLEFFLPRASNYSDDGKTWHGAYGPRMLAHNQLSDLIETFEREGKQTRRAILMIADPNLDNLTAIKEKYNGDSPKDIPCNREMIFYIVDNKLNAKVIQRSGDLIFGTGSINPFEFTVIQEMVYNMLLNVFPDLELGVYRWHITNAHIYSDYYEQAGNILSHRPPSKMMEETYVPSDKVKIFKGLQQEWLPRMIEEIVHDISKLIDSISDVSLEEGAELDENKSDRIRNLIDAAMYDGNTLFDQDINLVVSYTLGKKFDVTLQLPVIDRSLLDSVTLCKFTNFKLEVGSNSFPKIILGVK